MVHLVALWIYVLTAVLTRSIFTPNLTKTPHSSPVNARYGVSVVRSTSV